MELNFPKLEKKILKFWKENKTFEKSVKNRAGARDFVFYEGPPTANGRPGIHHVSARVLKDLICRYKTMRGFRVLRKAGWDTHGLPVELEVEKSLGLKSKKDIEKYGIEKFNAKCRQSVWKYKTEWEKLTERMAYWLDMENPYITYDNDYMETLWWIIKQIWRKNLLYQDYKVVPYCPRCGTSLSSHEVALGYKRVKENSIFVKFPVKGQKNTYLLVWTTTPWTLPGNVAVAVNPKENYVIIGNGAEKLVLEKSSYERLNKDPKPLFSIHGWEESSIKNIWEVKETFPGKKLVGWEYEPLYNFIKPDKPAWRVVGDSFVSTEEGTGLVHIAPAFGEDDMRVGKENNLPVLMTVDAQGKFKPEIKPWAGMPVKDIDPLKDVNPLIIGDLKSRSPRLLFWEEIYEHDYPFCWRCHSPLLYYAKESWFIKMSAVKDKLIKNNQKINWIPKHLKDGRFGEWLKELKDWAFSRERYWGTPLPIWQCQIGRNPKSEILNPKQITNTKNQKSGCGNIIVIGSKQDLLDQKFSANRYFLMRHGHAYLNQNKRICSWPEPYHCPLTKLGKKQVQALIPKLKKAKIDLIFSSDLLRTKQTAEIVAKALGLKVKYSPLLREISLGIFNGKPREEFWQAYSEQIEFFRKKPVGGESWNDCKIRMMKFIRGMDKKYQNKNILIVSHGDPLWLLDGAMSGLTDAELLDRKDGHKNYIKTGEMRAIAFKDLPYNNEGELDFHRPYIDAVKFDCPKCGGKMERVKEIIDVWFDSGAMPFGQAHWPFAWPKIKNEKLKMKNYVNAGFQFPADYICEAIDQTRGWFYTLLAISTLLGFESPYKNVISIGHVLDEKGEKMSKSKGNVVDPLYIIEKYGSDAMRWYFYTVNQPGDSKLFSEKDIDGSLKKFILTLWNSFAFFETYVSDKTQKSSPAKIFEKILGGPNSKNVLDRWIISRLNILALAATNYLEKYDITSAARAIDDFVINDLSNWYIRRSRRRFQKPENKKDFNDASQTLGYVLTNLSVICAPFIPFLSEEIYKKTRGNTSVHLANWLEGRKTLSDKVLIEDMNSVRTIVAEALKARAKAGIKVRQPLQQLKIKDKKIKNSKELLDLIKEELNIKEIVFDPAIKESIELDTRITAALKEEGIMREIIRHIQEMRKDGGYRPHHKIMIQYNVSKDLEDMWHRYEGYLRQETQAQKIIEKSGIHQQKQEVFDREREVQFDGEKIWLGIKKC